MKQRIILPEQYGMNRTPKGYRKAYQGELEFEIRDRHGRTLNKWREPNLIKIFAKEILSHRLPHSRVWDPNANTGAGDWVSHNLDLDEFAAKYISSLELLLIVVVIR
jgi:hypothetical protein